jgi:hypothetical protein
MPGAIALEREDLFVAGSSLGSASGFRTGFRFLTGYSYPTYKDAFTISFTHLPP